MIRPYLSVSGTVEEQVRGNTLVIRDTPGSVARIRPILENFDRPPQDLRFEIQIIRAGPARQIISPPVEVQRDAELPEELRRSLSGFCCATMIIGYWPRRR